MAKGLSPTQRTLRALRDEGRIAATTERWNAYAGIRQDLFGFIDIVVLDAARGIVAVQCTSGAHHAARRTKILNEAREYALEWIRCGGVIELWSWSKRKLVRGGKAVRWHSRVEELTVADF